MFLSLTTSACIQLTSRPRQHAATALERLQVSLAFDIDAAHEVLDTLRRELTTHAFETSGGGGEQPAEPPSAWDDPPPPPRPATRIVVIDTVTALLAPLLSSTSSQGECITPHIWSLC